MRTAFSCAGSAPRPAASGRPIRLEVDGGVKGDNIRAIAAAGADTFVAGSAIFNSPDYAATIARMREEIAAAAPLGGKDPDAEDAEEKQREHGESEGWG